MVRPQFRYPYSINAPPSTAHAHAPAQRTLGTPPNGRGSCYTYGQSFQTGDLIEVEINRDEGTINYYHNGEDQGEAHTGVPNDIDLYPAASALEIGDKLVFEGGGITPPQGTGPTTYGIKAVAYPSAFNAEGLAAAKTRLESEFAAFSRFHSGFDANFDAELIAVVAEYCTQNKTSPAAINPLEFNLSDEEISQHYHLRTALSRHDDNNGGEGTSTAAAGGSEVAVAETILDALQQRLVLLQAMNKAIQVCFRVVWAWLGVVVLGLVRIVRCFFFFFLAGVPKVLLIILHHME